MFMPYGITHTLQRAGIPYLYLKVSNYYTCKLNHMPVQLFQSNFNFFFLSVILLRELELIDALLYPDYSQLKLSCCIQRCLPSIFIYDA